jgi:hypothetical protein
MVISMSDQKARPTYRFQRLGHGLEEIAPLLVLMAVADEDHAPRVPRG